MLKWVKPLYMSQLLTFLWPNKVLWTSSHQGGKKYTPPLMSGTTSSGDLGSEEVLRRRIRATTLPHKKITWKAHGHMI